MLAEQNEKVWQKVKDMQSRLKKKGLFCTPVLARSALRLYDGTYIYASSPILLGAGYDRTFVVEGTTLSMSSGFSSFLSVSMQNIYKATAVLVNWDVGPWADIVDSIDIFLSTDINLPPVNSKYSKIVAGAVVTSETVKEQSFAIYFEGEEKNEQESIEKELISKGSFYKVASFSCTNPEDLSKGYDLMSDRELVSQDNLVLQEELTDEQDRGIDLIGRRLTVYNNRVISNGVTARLSSGHTTYPATAITEKVYVKGAAYSYCLRYHIRDDTGISHAVIGRSLSGMRFSPPYKEYIATESGGEYQYPELFGFITHPDDRCYKLEILFNGEASIIEMKPHPHLNCAYAYFGISTTVNEMQADGQTATLEEEEFLGEENRSYSESDLLAVSAANNPFLFPLSGRFHFSGSINGIATTTRALSTGQFGQFPLYVFTTDGIWAMTTTDEGSFSKATPLSREVALDRRVFPIDQAVIFITEKGVKILSGSEVTDLSPNMNGRHWVVEDDAKALLWKHDAWYQLLPPLKDKTPFMAFMKTAECMYDYTGARLIFFNDTAYYQYVYMLNTGTWHKTMQDLDPPYKIINTLNSYPNCQACALDEEVSETIVLDFSTPLDVTSEDERRCIIATRPFDLEEPDVLKTINHLKIRGQYERYDSNNKPRVSYMLFGSQDGNTFHRLTSLRGKSWKLFRVIILATLKPTERISWIDVDYEHRFNNRLR